MRILVVGHDLAPSEAFGKKIVPELEKRGYHVTAFLAKGSEALTPDQIAPIVAAVGDADAVLLGMSASSALAAEEIAAGEAARNAGKPFALFADTFMVHRTWFTDLEKDAAAVFTVNKKVADRVRKYYREGAIVVSGNPIWEDFFFPETTREAVRTKMRIAEREKVVLVPGGKVMEINRDLLQAAMNATHKVSNRHSCSYRVLFSVHPGDKTDPSAYYDLIANPSNSAEIVTKAKASTDDLVLACDILIESMSTAGIYAACQRKPVIDYLTERALDRLEKMTGMRTWDLCEEGAACAVYERRAYQRMDFCGDPARAIAVQMARLLTDECPEGKQLRDVQEKLFVEPKERGMAVRVIADTLETFVGK